MPGLCASNELIARDEGKTNFFESRPTQYQKASVLNKSRDNIFNFVDEF